MEAFLGDLAEFDCSISMFNKKIAVEKLYRFDFRGGVFGVLLKSQKKRKVVIVSFTYNSMNNISNNKITKIEYLPTILIGLGVSIPLFSTAYWYYLRSLKGKNVSDSNNFSSTIKVTTVKSRLHSNGTFSKSNEFFEDENKGFKAKL
jgi:hypothetical protein